MTAPKTRVLIVDDSAAYRMMWKKILSAEPDIEVVGSASDGKVAIEQIAALGADIVLLDIEMPNMDGLTAIPLLLRARPGVRIVVASALSTHGSQVAIRALLAGATDYVPKPTSLSEHGSLETVAKSLIEKVRVLSKRVQERARQQHETAVRAGPRRKPRAIVVGSSTGGPSALSLLLTELPAAVRAPILIVQHMPPFFITALAERLAKETGRDVREGRHGEPVVNGAVYLAPGDSHMAVEPGPDGAHISISHGEPVNFCRPAVDVLFGAAAAYYGPELLAVVLTGMGEDGKAGAGQVVAAGGTVLAQDEATSVVWGMPGAVAKAGYASSILPLSRIPLVIGELVKGSAA
ncbi:MAG TPA: chemotaxis response regulator protein-glutamate methylesterase [Bdellovibrionales bacterium]|nr:chemotaxis response regulator protein-glutamate methylesterase [Bdellovibrionales bacterium]